MITCYKRSGGAFPGSPTDERLVPPNPEVVRRDREVGNDLDGRIDEQLAWVNVAAVGRAPEALGEAGSRLGQLRLGRQLGAGVVPENPDVHGAPH
jgi:hypothetical protein